MPGKSVSGISPRPRSQGNPVLQVHEVLSSQEWREVFSRGEGRCKGHVTTGDLSQKLLRLLNNVNSSVGQHR